MSGKHSISRHLLLASIFVGLNVLCLLGVKHGPRVARHTRVNYSHIPSRGINRTGSRNDGLGFTAAGDAVVDHVAIEHTLKFSAAKVVAASPAVDLHAVVSQSSALLPRPEDYVEPLPAQVNVLALGSAPRAPDLGRAPPAA